MTGQPDNTTPHGHSHSGGSVTNGGNQRREVVSEHTPHVSGPTGEARIRTAVPAPGADSAYERRAYAERMFDVSACERLQRSGRQYQDEHGYYLPTLAWLLNETRRELAEARGGFGY